MTSMNSTPNCVCRSWPISRFAYLLEGSLAGRVFDYSTSGTDSTISAGLRWRPIEEISYPRFVGPRLPRSVDRRICSAAARASMRPFWIRAATSTGLALELTASRQPAVGIVVNNCIAQGVPADGTFVSATISCRYSSPAHQRCSRKPAKAGTSASCGVRIGSTTPLERQRHVRSQLCEHQHRPGDPSAGSESRSCRHVRQQRACSAITRSASGAVRAIDDPLTNGGFVETHAIDFTINWTSPDWSIGRFSASSNINHLIDFIDGSTSPAVHREGTERGSPSQGYPDWKATTTVNWDFHDWGASVTNRYISSLIETANGNTRSTRSRTGICKCAGRPHNFADGHLQLALGVNNITDVDTPGCFSCDVNNMDPTLYDLPGRFGYVRSLTSTKFKSASKTAGRGASLGQFVCGDRLGANAPAAHHERHGGGCAPRPSQRAKECR